MSEIFISYRRNDASAYAGRIADSLRRCFGEEYIFRDYETLDIGVQFKQEIQNFILSSSIILVVIGPDWIGVDPKTGKQRLDNPEDFVRLEVEYALEHGITLIPLLVGGAKMPDSSLLPKKMRGIGKFNAHQLTETHWNADIGLLVKKLELETGLDCKVEGTAQHWLSGFLPLFHVAPNFLSLLRSPKRFLRKCSFGRSKDMLNALLFFAIFILLANIYLHNTWMPEGAEFWSLIVLDIPLWLLVTVLLSIPMWFSWWIVGVRNHYLKTMVILLYQVSMTVMIAYTGFTIMTVGLFSHGKEKIQNAFNIMTDPNIEEIKKYQSVTEIFETAWSGPLSFIFLGLSVMIFMALPIWLTVSWGAYREAFSKTRWVSLLTFLIYCIVLGLPVLFLAWLGQGTQ